MSKPYLDQSPTERAAEDKEYARLAVEAHRAKQLSTYTPTVIRDLEQQESEQA